MTFFLYGVGPAALVAYLMGTPARKRGIKKREAEELAAFRATQQAAVPSTEPDASGHAASGHERPTRIAPVGKEP